jgi:hypothetical protein
MKDEERQPDFEGQQDDDFIIHPFLPRSEATPRRPEGK